MMKHALFASERGKEGKRGEGENPVWTGLPRSSSLCETRKGERD